jgi:hypothetical protein
VSWTEKKPIFLTFQDKSPFLSSGSSSSGGRGGPPANGRSSSAVTTTTAASSGGGGKRSRGASGGGGGAWESSLRGHGTLGGGMLETRLGSGEGEREGRARRIIRDRLIRLMTRPTKKAEEGFSGLFPRLMCPQFSLLPAISSSPLQGMPANEGK